MKLTLDAAARLVDLALAKGLDMGLKPLTVAVLDAGGHLKAFKRGDAPGILRPDLAIGKAWSALAMGCGTRTLAAIAEKSPGHINSLVTIASGRIVPNPGGILLFDNDGEVIGAIGVSGDTSDNDEAAAIHAVTAMGIKGDPGTGGPPAKTE